MTRPAPWAMHDTTQWPEAPQATPEPARIAFSAPFDAKAELERTRKRFALLTRIVACDDVIETYNRMGISDTPHDVEHKAMRASLVAELGGPS